MVRKAFVMDSVSGGAHVLGLDIGTSSVRALLYDSGAVPLTGINVQLTYAPDVSIDGGVTLEAGALFDRVAGVIDQAVEAIHERGLKVSGVGVSCFWHSLLALGSDGSPLTAVLLWADTRSETRLPELAARTDQACLRARTGCGLHSTYWPAKLTWLAAKEPSVIQRAHRFVSFAEYMFFRLFHRFAVSVSMASGTGLLNLDRCQWDEYAASICPPGTTERVSPIDDRPFASLTDSFAIRWSPLASCEWFPALGDGACANLGTLARPSDGSFVLTIGTSAAVRAFVDQPSGGSRDPTGGSRTVLPPALWNYRLDRRTGVVGGALSEGGNVIAWLRTVLKLGSLDLEEAAIMLRPPDAGRLTVLPLIAGERSPYWHTGARATFSGITLATTPIDLLQGAMESIGYELRMVFDLMREYLGDPAAVFASGAALGRSEAWTRMLSNILNFPLIPAPRLESSSRGAAVFALAQLGVLDAGHSTDGGPPTITPVPSVVYDRARLRHQLLRERLLGDNPSGRGSPVSEPAGQGGERSDDEGGAHQRRDEKAADS